VIFVVVVVLVLALVLAVIIGVARNPGPSAADTAIGYELAWDRLDFDAVYHLMGDELRENLTRQEFVAAQRAAQADGERIGHLVEHVSVELVDEGKEAAVVVTRLELRDGGEIQHELWLAHRDSWLVVLCSLRPAPAT
jgi:hypothetical protein